jgi:hypothetical protein
MLIAILVVFVGTVTDASSRWQGDVIVTEARVRDATGSTIKVVQRGGSVDGLGMTFTHEPALVHEGDSVTIDLATSTVVAVAPHAAVTPADGNAMYGVQRTAKSGSPLWRDGGCLELSYDAVTISADEARVIDAAFETWSVATVSCGRMIATSTRRLNPPSARDELSTVRIRRDRWCNPGNAFEPEVCYAKQASAVTRLLFVDDPNDANDGKILDADIELNAVDYVLLRPSEPAPATTKPVLDLQAVATHEAGHVLGLAHNCGTGDEAWPSDHAGNVVPACETGSPTVRAATMYYAVAPGDVGPRSVETTDVVAACELARGLTCESYVTGGCNAGHGGASWLVLALVSASSFLADRGARSRRLSSCTRRRHALDPTAG